MAWKIVLALIFTVVFIVSMLIPDLLPFTEIISFLGALTSFIGAATTAAKSGKAAADKARDAYGSYKQKKGVANGGRPDDIIYDVDKN